MIRKTNILLMVVLVVALMSCRDEFWPELTEYENLLVVDGMITNEPGPYEVRLSLSSPVQNPEERPLPNANVIIEDDEGVSEVLSEIEAGVYQTDKNGLQGVIGKSYRVVINMPGGKTYTSDWQKILEPVGIEDVYVEVETVQTEDENYPLYGYQFYVDTELAKSDSTYFLWRMDGDYKYRSNFLARYYWDGRLSRFPNPDSLYVCYGKDNISDFVTMSTQEFSVPKLDRIPLTYVTTETLKLSVRYTLMLKQYTLNSQAYSFYAEIEDLNSQEGALYTEQPFQVRGNVYDASAPDDFLLGYFLAAGISEKRIFVDRPKYVEFRYGVCKLTRADTEAFGYIGWSDPVTWPLLVTTNENGQMALPSQDCIDCRRKGGSLEKPPYWED